MRVAEGVGGERSRTRKPLTRVKDGEKGVKEVRGERRERSLSKSLHIGTLSSFPLSPYLAKNGYLLLLSLLSLFHPPARIGPRARVHACVCEGGVKVKEGKKSPRMKAA